MTKCLPCCRFACGSYGSFGAVWQPEDRHLWNASCVTTCLGILEIHRKTRNLKKLFISCSSWRWSVSHHSWRNSSMIVLLDKKNVSAYHGLMNWSSTWSLVRICSGQLQKQRAGHVTKTRGDVQADSTQQYLPLPQKNKPTPGGGSVSGAAGDEISRRNLACGEGTCRSGMKNFPPKLIMPILGGDSAAVAVINSRMIDIR